MSDPKPFKITIKWGGVLEEERPVDTYEFATQAELDAFNLALAESEGWMDYDLIEDLSDEDLFLCDVCYKVKDIEDSIKAGSLYICVDCRADLVERSMGRLLGSVRT